MVNKLIRLFLPLVTICTFGLLAFPHSIFAQTLLFSDNFNSPTPQDLVTYNPNYTYVQGPNRDHLVVYNGQLTDPSAYESDYGYAGVGPIQNPCSVITATLNQSSNIVLWLLNSPSSMFPGFAGFGIYRQGGYFYTDNSIYTNLGSLSNFNPYIPHTFSFCLVGNQQATFSVDNTIIDKRDINPMDWGYTALSYAGFDTNNGGVSGTNGFIITNFSIEGTLPNQPPTVNPISNATINEGNTYTVTGSFTDTDSTSWTATVNYGDGGGDKPLTLNPDKTFSLSHQYTDEGTYTVTVKVTDNQGATGTGTATITVNDVTPTIGTISVSNPVVQINTPITATATFTDPAVDTHTAIWDWGDGTPTSPDTTPGTITEPNGSNPGTVGADSHTYTNPGVYPITLTVKDDDGTFNTKPFQYISVYNPTTQGLFTAGQRFSSPAGADPSNPNVTGDVRFGLSYKYQGTMPVGDRQFIMNFKTDNNFTFNATTLSSLVISNGIGTLTGTGTVNGSGTYNFLVTGSESAQTIRIQITDSSNNVIYDTQPGALATATPTTAVTSGHVLAH